MKTKITRSLPKACFVCGLHYSWKYFIDETICEPHTPESPRTEYQKCPHCGYNCIINDQLRSWLSERIFIVFHNQLVRVDYSKVMLGIKSSWKECPATTLTEIEKVLEQTEIIIRPKLEFVISNNEEIIDLVLKALKASKDNFPRLSNARYKKGVSPKKPPSRRDRILKLLKSPKSK